MAKFVNTPPEVGVPRADHLPVQAQVPDELDVIPTEHFPEDVGPPEGLPMIPVENFPDDLPDAAKDALEDLPEDIFL